MRFPGERIPGKGSRIEINIISIIKISIIK